MFFAETLGFRPNEKHNYARSKSLAERIFLHASRSEQSQGSVFYLRDKIDKTDFFYFYLSEISLKCEIGSFFCGSKQKKDTTYKRNSKLNFLPQKSCQWYLNISFLLYLFVPPSDEVFIKNIRFMSIFSNLEKKGEFERNFSNTLLKGSNWITSWVNMVLTQWLILGYIIFVR